jgi:ribonuclease VapC
MNEPVVLDASALIALLNAEPGQEAVAAVLPGARMSAVNLAEVISKLAERGMPAPDAHADALALGIDVVPFGSELARDVGALRPLTRASGLSLGDRCCLALARQTRSKALTADHRWSGLAGAVGIAIHNIRPRTT